MSVDLVFSESNKEVVLTYLQKQLNELHFTPQLLPLFKGCYDAVERLADLPFSSVNTEYSINLSGGNGKDGASGSPSFGILTKHGDDGQSGGNGGCGGNIVLSLISVPNSLMYAVTHPTAGTRFLRLNEKSSLALFARGGNGGDGGSGGNGADGSR